MFQLAECSLSPPASFYIFSANHLLSLGLSITLHTTQVKYWKNGVGARMPFGKGREGEVK